MNRQFHAKVSMRSYVLLAALLSVAISFIWSTEHVARQWIGVVLAVVLLIMVVVIERIINTTYTITTEGTLVIHEGRFSKDVVISIGDIDRIDRINRYRIAGRPLLSYLVVVLSDGKEYGIMPKNEENFIKCITRKRENVQEDQQEDC
mgnify:FL=1